MQIKRYASHREAFQYYLEVLKKSRKEGKITKDERILVDIYFRVRGFNITSKHTYEETLILLDWDFIDNEIRQIYLKKSRLSKFQRDTVMFIFNWVDHFVAKDGEEVTQRLKREEEEGT